MKFENFFQSYVSFVEQTLLEVLPKGDAETQELHEAMHYATMGGGKRFRPVLSLLSCEAVGGSLQDAKYAAAAVELIHCYSLVHDDLPALDNDDLRRGQPTCHRKYGESTAILVGDALLTLAFEVISKVEDPKTAQQLVLQLSTAAGSCGMIGGQFADLTLGQSHPDVRNLDYINLHKTGKLIQVSVVAGALAGHASTETVKSMVDFGELLGLAFQLVDDMLDGDGYLKFMSYEEVRNKGLHYLDEAQAKIDRLGASAKELEKMVRFLRERMPKDKHVSVD